MDQMWHFRTHKFIHQISPRFVYGRSLIFDRIYLLSYRITESSPNTKRLKIEDKKWSFFWWILWMNIWIYMYENVTSGPSHFSDSTSSTHEIETLKWYLSEAFMPFTVNGKVFGEGLPIGLVTQAPLGPTESVCEQFHGETILDSLTQSQFMIVSVSPVGLFQLIWS